jgi:hypothetical protein
LRDAFVSTAALPPPDNTPSPEEIARCVDHLDAEAAALPHTGCRGLGKIGFDACCSACDATASVCHRVRSSAMAQLSALIGAINAT